MPTYKNIAVVWVNEDKNGNKYLAFKAEQDIKEGETVNLFKNDKGDNPARPDFRAYEKVEDDPESVASEVPFQGNKL